MEERKLNKKKATKTKITLEDLEEKIYSICYPINDTWYKDWTRKHGTNPTKMLCKLHDDEKYNNYKSMIKTELKKYPELRKEYDLQVAEYKLDSEMGFLAYYGMTDEQIEEDSRIKKLKRNLEKIKTTDYTKIDMEK